MKTPEIYSEWCEIFDKIETWEIGHQDANILEAMDKGNIRWVSGVAERITQRLLSLVNNRLNKLNMFYAKRLVLAQNSVDMEHLLILYRKELVFIKRMASLEMLPKELRKTLTQEVMEVAKKAQKSLEDSSKKDLSGMLKRIVTRNRIDNI